MVDGPKSEGLKASAEIAKQMRALCTGAVAFTITFLDKFTTNVHGSKTVPASLYVAWVLFDLNILFCRLDADGDHRSSRQTISTLIETPRK